MEDIDSVARTVTNTTLAILTGIDKTFQSLFVYPVSSLDDAKAAEDPPRVADIR